jgi:arginyl-tRNA synthetase
MAEAGPACGRSDLLAGTAVVVPPWPDPGSARTWRQAWEDQASAMTARLAVAAGASSTIRSGGERAALCRPQAESSQSPVRAAAEYFGADAIRYRLARTLPGQAGRLDTGAAAAPGRYAVVQLAHAEAASTLRWADELEMAGRTPQSDAELAALLASRAERELLGLLSWFPQRVATAARRQRAAEVPHYLEQVCAAWAASRLVSPALPFGGAAASRDPAVAAARLVLADAVRAVLAAGLALAGIGASDRI